MTERSTAGRKVLLAEDHPDTREIYAAALTAAGFKVFEARSRASIVGVARQQSVDVVVMDLSLAGERLADLLTQLADSQGRAPRLIAVTGRSPEGEPWEEQFDHYLVKPVLPDALIAAVRDALSR